MLSIENLIDLKDKNVVITGAASGMAKAASELLISLGANVYAIDRNDIDLDVKKAIKGDLSNEKAIDEVVSQLPDTIHAAYLCCGVALMKDREQMIMDINYFGQKYLAESILPRIVDEGSVTFISSTGGYAYMQHKELMNEVLAIETFDEFNKWVNSHLDIYNQNTVPDVYSFSKECLNAYVKSKAREGDYIKRKVRINAIGPSYSSTGLISDFNKAISPDGSDEGGAKIMEDMFLKSWNGRPGTSEDMGYPLVIIGSKLCSYMSGQIIYIDYGLTGDMDYKSFKD
jgi:NAD(P)-dependent dehydrogenase (short-subunit alcohol dehydrogenase family)